MKKYLQYLESKGYTVVGDEAVLSDVTFKIKCGSVQTAIGKQKLYWLELKGFG